VFERFTTSAREVVVAARYEAGRLRSPSIGTEHLLLGLLGLADGPSDPGTQGVAGRVLTQFAITPEYVRAQIARLAGTSGEGLGAEDAEALGAIGIDLDAVRSRLEESFGEGVLDRQPGGPPAGRMPLTPGVKKVLALALRDARQLASGNLGSEHLLLGLLREEHGRAGQILAARAPLDTIRERVLAELAKAA
jgi:ATP-dependent Clp protease ATP-binding subunit ClpA